MNEELEIKLALAKVGSIGSAQSRYANLAILFAVAGYAGLSEGILWMTDVSSIGIALCVMAWFGVARSAGQISAKLKQLIPDYNYAMYNGAPPFIWALAYSAHGQGGLRRIMALASFPLAFTALLLFGVALVMPESPFTVYTLVYAVPIYQVVGLWKSRVKSMVK
ncbi:hypothetical protein OAF54_02815 [bacterium]|nr:hypothetical protein [bacterium]